MDVPDYVFVLKSQYYIHCAGLENEVTVRVTFGKTQLTSFRHAKASITTTVSRDFAVLPPPNCTAIGAASQSTFGEWFDQV